jgi:biotin carboxyl carrier protein
MRRLLNTQKSRNAMEARTKGNGPLKLQITIDGKTYAAEVEVLEDDATKQQDKGPDAAATQSPAPGAYAPSRRLETRSADEKLYHSPLNGLVIAVKVAPGQAIEAGDVIVVLEAMKMETSVTAHHAGKVKTVSVKAGESVKLHQELVELE